MIAQLPTLVIHPQRDEAEFSYSGYSFETRQDGQLVRVTVSGGSLEADLNFTLLPNEDGWVAFDAPFLSQYIMMRAPVDIDQASVCFDETDRWSVGPFRFAANADGWQCATHIVDVLRDHVYMSWDITPIGKWEPPPLTVVHTQGGSPVPYREFRAHLCDLAAKATAEDPTPLREFSERMRKTLTAAKV